MTSLALIPAFRALPPATLTAVARDSRALRFGPGAVIRRAGQRAPGVLLLLSGTVVATYNSASGAAVWPARWQGPAILDKPEVLQGGAPPTGLLATTPAVARLLPRDRFLRLLEKEQVVRKHVLDRLACDVLVDRHRLAQAATLPALAQVAAWLGTRSAEHPLAWRGSQEELALVLGLSRVTVNRALARLARAGAVRVTPRGIVVTDLNCLGAFSDGS